MRILNKVCMYVRFSSIKDIYYIYKVCDKTAQLEAIEGVRENVI